MAETQATTNTAPTDAVGPAADAPTTEDASTAALHALLAERDDYKDKWARARADLDNYRKRIQREMEDDRKYAAVPIVKAILPGLDGLQRAIQAAATATSVADLRAGVELVVKQFEAAFSGLGVTAIEAVGQPFDPNRHEAIAQQPSADHPPMTVLLDVERGYTLHERVLRPSKVIVSSAPAQ